MSTTVFDLSAPEIVVPITRGDKWRIPFTLTVGVDNDPIDLSTATLTATLRRDEDMPVVLEFDCELVTDGTDGEVDLVADPEDTIISGRYVGDIQAILDDGPRTLVKFSVPVQRDVTYEDPE